MTLIRLDMAYYPTLLDAWSQKLNTREDETSKYETIEESKGDMMELSKAEGEVRLEEVDKV